MDYEEKPIFNTLREEVIGNAASTIESKLHLNYHHQCYIFLINRRKHQFELNDLLSMKFYTDTNQFQSSLRKAFWETTPKKVKRSFYQWAIQLYKTALFHSKHITKKFNDDQQPKPIYHGMIII